jgi:hypothetical protein
LRRFGVIDGIAKLRGVSNWAYVQRNQFLGQGDDTDKMFVFKMFEVGPASGVDLVRRMQPSEDLENAWMMSDHVKRVKGWITMAAHVYDGTYQRIITISCCDFNRGIRMPKFSSGRTSTTSWPVTVSHIQTL